MLNKRHLPRESGFGDSAEVNVVVSDREGWVQDIMGIVKGRGGLARRRGL